MNAFVGNTQSPIFNFVSIIVKKILLGLILMLVSFSSIAEWTLVAGTDEFDVHAHDATIRKVGNNAKMWELFNYKTRQINEISSEYYWSSKRQKEYDCGEGQARILAFTHFSEPEGKGKVLYTSPKATDWRPVAPDSVGYALWQIACGKNN